jgi:hypothetical protein
MAAVRVTGQAPAAGAAPGWSRAADSVPVGQQMQWRPVQCSLSGNRAAQRQQPEVISIIMMVLIPFPDLPC